MNEKFCFRFKQILAKGLSNWLTAKVVHCLLHTQCLDGVGTCVVLFGTDSFSSIWKVCLHFSLFLHVLRFVVVIEWNGKQGCHYYVIIS